MFITDAAVQQSLADALKRTNDSAFAATWADIVTESHAWAYGEIVGILLGRGFLITQINAWDYGGNAERSLSVYQCLARGASTLANVDSKGYEALDNRKAMREMTALAVGGVWQAPAGTAGLVASGALDGSGDLFGTPTDPDDPRLGRVVRW